MRIFTSDNKPLDFCDKHIVTEERAFELYGNLGDGPDDRGNCFEYDADHPDYDSWDYFCHHCGRRLIATRPANGLMRALAAPLPDDEAYATM